MANILERRLQLRISEPQLSNTQLKIDRIIKAVPEHLSDVSSFTAILTGGLAYRFGKMAILGNSFAQNAPLLFKTLAPLGGLAAEVSAYRSSLYCLETHVFSEGIFSSGWMNDFVNFGTLKGFAKLAQNTNRIFTNFIQDNGMVAGHYVAASLGLAPSAQGSLLDQYIEAEVLNAQMKAGLGTLHYASGGKILAYERSLDLFLDVPRSPALSIHFTKQLPSMASVILDDLGFPIEASAPKEIHTLPKYSQYFWKFYNPERSLFNPLKGRENFGKLGISKVFGTAVIGTDGVSIVHFAAKHPVEMKAFNEEHVLASDAEAYQRISKERYEEKKDRFSTYASLFWHFFLAKKNKDLADRIFQIAKDVANQDPRFINFIVQEGDLTPFLRRFLSVPDQNEKVSQLAFCEEVAQRFLGEIYTQYGINPFLFALRMQDQMVAGYYLSTPSKNDLIFGAFHEGRTNGGEKIQVVSHLPAIQRAWTIDIFQNLLKQKPWQKDFDPFHPKKVSASGVLYTSYYTGKRPGDFTDLYYALRDRNLDSAEKQKLMNRAVESMLPLIDKTTHGNTLLLPVISGSFPTEELASQLGERAQVQVLANPWEARPPEYGAGVEGKILASKVELVGKYLKLRHGMADQIKGKDIILVDDNITDGVTFLMAQFALYKASANTVKLIALTRTVRHSEDHDGTAFERLER